MHIKNAVWKPAETLADGTVRWAWEWAPLREGMGDVPAYLSALRGVGYDGWVTVEDFTTVLPLEQRLADDLAYLRACAARRARRRRRRTTRAVLTDLAIACTLVAQRQTAGPGRKNSQEEGRPGGGDLQGGRS